MPTKKKTKAPTKKATKVSAVKKGKNKPAPKARVKAAKVPKMSIEQVVLHLDKAINQSVYNTLKRYENGNMSSIFNESELKALAQDTALEVARRVQLFYANPNQKNAVNPKGAEAYFRTAFIHQSQKMYEKYAKTDTRAGVQTISSDEAMAVASNRNFISPENQYILNNKFNKLLEDLQLADEKYNMQVRLKALEQDRNVSSAELQHSAIIIQKSLEGFEANEIREQLKLDAVDYARHRREALDLAKSKMGCTLADLSEHLEVSIDHRILSREVKKRKKPKNRVINYSIDSNFYIHTTTSPDKLTCVTSLFARIDFKDGDDRVKEIPSQTVEMEKVSGPVDKAMAVRQEMWDKTKLPEIRSKIEEIGMKYLTSFKSSNRQKTA